MPKHIDSVPSLAKFRPPWITEDGTEVEIDKDKLTKYIHGLVSDKAKAQDSRDEAVEKLTATETERDEYKEQVDSKDPDQGKKIAKLEQDLADQKAATAKADARADRAEVVASVGLDERQAKYLPETGTKEELEAKAKEILEDFGPAKESEEDPEEDPEDEGFYSPRSDLLKLTNGGDPAQQADKDYDYEKVADQLVGNRAL